jgi:hypothetical protein
MTLRHPIRFFFLTAILLCSLAELISAQVFNGRSYQFGMNGNGRNYQAAAADMLVDFHACTNGSAPTTTCLANSTYGESGDLTWSVASAGANLTISNANQPVWLIVPAIISNILYAGTGGLSLSCTTSGSGSSCGYASVQLSNTSTATTLTFSMIITCPTSATQCGAQGGLDDSDAHYDSPHFAADANAGELYLETDLGISASYLSYAASTRYDFLVNMQDGTTATQTLLVCNGSTGVLLATLSRTGSPSANNKSVFMGITGEEPTTSGYVYQWFNYRVYLNGKLPLGGPCG